MKYNMTIHNGQHTYIYIKRIIPANGKEKGMIIL